MKLCVGILGATGMVGQRFVTLLADHPWFEVVCLAASPRSAGQAYGRAVEGRWSMTTPVPAFAEGMVVRSVQDDLQDIASQVGLVFCALDLDKAAIKQIEEAYAAAGVAVISNNSAHRWTDDVPMLIPEVNPEHARLIDVQRQNRGWDKGLIAVKPNCSIQSYVAVLTALQDFEPTDVSVVSMQAVSGAGKTVATYPEMADNLIPFISGEEEKSIKEPLKIWGDLSDGALRLASAPKIFATCIRVPISDGHLAQVSVRFQKKPTRQQVLAAIQNFHSPLAALNLPSAPKNFLTYLSDEDRPQPRLDRDRDGGMGISIGRLREDPQFGWQFISLAHNTVRGAAGGAILMAELLMREGYVRG